MIAKTAAARAVVRIVRMIASFGGRGTAGSCASQTIYSAKLAPKPGCGRACNISPGPPQHQTWPGRPAFDRFRGINHDDTTDTTTIPQTVSLHRVVVVNL